MAAVTVGQLAVRLEAQTKEFSRELNSATKRMDEFEKDAVDSTDKAGKGFSGLAGTIGLVAGALATLGAGAALISFTQGAIEADAAFEQLNVRITTLLGSQEGANKALEAFVELSTKTPFAVQQIVGGATTLASVVEGNRESLVELTVVAANLAAVTGLSFQDAAGNLQRALSAGIASADLFRERGVRQLIESITGIPDITKAPLERQKQAFIETFGEFGAFGDAAEDLSNTVGGAFSNIGDAADNAKRALGDALAPSTFSVVKGLIIPAFVALKDIFDRNSEAIAEFAQGLVQGVLKTFAAILDIGADTLRLLNEFGIDLDDLGRLFDNLKFTAGFAFDAIKVGFDTLIAGAALLGEGFALVGNALGLISDADVTAIQQFRRESIQGLVEDAGELETKFGEIIPRIVDGIAGLGVGTDQWADSIESAGDKILQVAENVAVLASDFRQMRDDAAAATDEGAAEAARLAAQIARDIGGFEDEDEFSQKILAAEIKENEKLQLAAARKAARATGKELNDSVIGGLEDALLALAEGEGIEAFAASLADTSADFLTDALTDALANIDFGGLGGGTGAEDGGGFDFGAGIGAAFGIGLSLITSQIAGTQASVRNEFAQSAVTGVQNVRGVVAGATNIPIVEVGEILRTNAALQTREIQQSNRLLSRIAAAVEGLDFTDPASLLADALAPEFANATALG